MMASTAVETTSDITSANDEVVENVDVHFEPVVTLDHIEVPTMEENENVIGKFRAKVYRFDTKNWKERGVGDLKILQHKTSGKVRVLMRREKIMKICANHYITHKMELKTLKTSEKAWTYTAFSDFSDGESKNELLSIRFQTEEAARQFKGLFESAQKISQDIHDGNDPEFLESLPSKKEEEETPKESKTASETSKQDTDKEKSVTDLKAEK